MASQHHRHVHRWRDAQGWETAQIDVSGEGERGTSIFTQGYPLAVEPKIEYTARLWTNYHFYWLNWKNHGTKWAMASIRSFSRRLGG